MVNLTGTSILKLNTYCLFLIFKLTRNNCELSENIDRYRDLINFGLSNDYIRSVYLDWIDDDLWARLEVKRACLLSGERVYLNLAEIYESLKPYTISEKLKFWDILSTSLTENSDLRPRLRVELILSRAYGYIRTDHKIASNQKKLKEVKPSNAK